MTNPQWTFTNLFEVTIATPKHHSISVLPESYYADPKKKKTQNSEDCRFNNSPLTFNCQKPGKQCPNNLQNDVLKSHHFTFEYENTP